MNTRDIFKINLNSFIDKSGKNKRVISSEMGIPYTTLVEWSNGRKFPRADGIESLAKYFGILKSDLLEERARKKTQQPNITEDFTTFPVIGEVAAGYNHPALEDWEGDTVEIPNSYLKGREYDDFFVLKVKGDSMYPAYQDGDKVLVLKQNTLNFSGQVGVVLYDDELGTLKKVEYKTGEDWMRLIPINPSYPPIKIEKEQLEHCRILGIPRLLIREINE